MKKKQVFYFTNIIQYMFGQIDMIFFFNLKMQIGLQETVEEEKKRVEAKLREEKARVARAEAEGSDNLDDLRCLSFY